MFLFTNIILYAIAALQLVRALPVVNRIVISPPITSPEADTVWTPGSSQLVTWDPSVVPPNGTFPGMLVLGRQTPGSENLNPDQPLAAGFSLRDGSVRVTCPTVSPGNNYIVVLFGDSGNASPQFTISSPSESDSPASGPSPNHDVASPNTQPSSAGLAPSPPASTLSTSVPTSTSGPLVLALTMSPSTSPNVPRAKSSAAGHTSLSPSSSKESTSSSAPTAYIGPPAGLNSNDAISRIRNPGAMIGGAVVSVFTIFLL